MDSCIMSVGTELLVGQIVNTNVVYLSQELNHLGINVYYHFTVGDNPDRLKDLLKAALEKTDIVILTGGLGPTEDDLTKETIAKVMDVPLELDEFSYEKICEYFLKNHKKMDENNKKQAYLPKNSKVLSNSCGTAPGFIIEKNKKIVISLPGPPKEMKTMFDDHVKEYLKTKSHYTIHSKTLRLFGIGESSLETKICDLTHENNPTVATYAKEGEVSIRITAKAENIDQAKNLINPVIEKINERVGEFIYSYEDQELVQVVGNELMKRNLSISLAESCTGGRIAAYFTNVSGISQCLNRGLVTYSNEAKMDELGVRSDTLDEYGAVSYQTAKEMVLGLKEKTKSDICLSVTGIAGPLGGSDTKPVGLVYIGITYKDQFICKEYHFNGNRERIRNHTTLSALHMILNLLK